MIRTLICKLPRWMGGGHVWRRLRKSEREGFVIVPPQLRICKRCPITYMTKTRKRAA